MVTSSELWNRKPCTCCTPSCHSTASVFASSTRSAMVSMLRSRAASISEPTFDCSKRVGGQALHQRAVDLDEIQRQRAEHGQRIDARAVVFQCEAHAHRLQCGGEAQDVGGIAGRDRFGDLDAETPGLEPEGLQHVRNPHGQRSLERAVARDAREHAASLRGLRQPQRLRDHPAVDEADEAAALGAGHERRWQDFLAFVVGHAHQRVDQRRAAGKTGDGLLHDAEAVLGQRGADLLDPCGHHRLRCAPRSRFAPTLPEAVAALRACAAHGFHAHRSRWHRACRWRAPPRGHR